MATLPVSQPTPARLDRSVVGVLLVALTLIVVAGVIFLLWSRIAVEPSLPSERYFPVPQGATFTYRLRQPDGSITYRARNVTRQDLNFFVGRMTTIKSFYAALVAAGVKIEPKEFDAIFQETNTDRMGALLDALRNHDGIQINEVEYNARGETTRHGVIFGLLTPERFDQFAVDGIGITPPVPLLPVLNGTQQITGTLNQSIPYTATLELETHGTFDTAIGKFPDCIQVRSTFTTNANASQSHTWYCGEVGEVYDETTSAAGTTRTEIVGASVGAFLRGSAPVLPRLPAFATLENIFPQPLAGTPKEVSVYKNSEPNSNVTTNVLPVGETLLFGTQGGALVAVSSTSGQELWRFQTADAIYSTPVVANGIVYFGSSGRRVYAVRMTDGAFLWAFPMKDIISSSPAVRGDTVYVSSEDRSVYALDADTGILRWTFRSASPFIAQPVVYENMLLVSNADGELSALNAATGTVVWQHSAPRAIVASVTVRNGLVYVGGFSRDLYATDRNVFALNIRDGHVVWSQELGEDVQQPIVVTDTHAYVTANAKLVAFDALNGSRLWQYTSNAALKGAPILLGDRLWVLAPSVLSGLDARTGQLLEQIPTGDVPVSAGLSSEGRALYIGFFNGDVKRYAGAAP